MLWGVHAFWIHPILVWLSWIRVYGKIPDWSETIAIIFHDSYWGCKDIDGDSGKLHPVRGAKWARWLGGKKAEELALFHSRSFSAANNWSPSSLSNPDKFSILLEFRWFYLLRAKLSGELREFRDNAVRDEGLLPNQDWFQHYINMVKNEFQNVIYLPLGGGKFTKVDSDCPIEIIQQKWSANTKTPGRTYAYRAAKRSEERGKTHVYLHAHILGVTNCEVDHINGDALDNRRANLRACLHSENGRNLQKWKSPTSSRYKGVCKRPAGNWQAYISFQRKQKYLGLFESEADAAKAYDVAAKQIFGKFARLNLPT